MANQRILATEEMVGYGHATKADTLNRLTMVEHSEAGVHGAVARASMGTAPLVLGSDADGDMYYRASGALARLAKGTANFKQFMNAGATAPEWALGYKVKVATRVGTAVSGDVAYTGYGFKPSLLICAAYIYGTFEWCVGMDDGSTHYCLEAVVIAAAPVLSGAAKLVAIWQDGTNTQDAYVKSFDADGFTLTWAKTGDGVTGDIQIYIAAFR